MKRSRFFEFMSIIEHLSEIIIIKGRRSDMKQINTVRDILESSSQNYTNRTAFVLRDSQGAENKISYSKFMRDTDALVLALTEKLGLHRKHIGIMGDNSYFWCVSYFAVLSSDSVAVPLDKDNPADETAELMKFGDVSVLICDGKSARKIAEHTDEHILIICSDSTDDGRMISLEALLEYGHKTLGEGKRPARNTDPDAMAVLLFTSGTTGVAKGVMLSNRNIVSDLKAVSGNVNISYEDRSLSVLPLHHTYESISVLMVLSCGGTVCFASSFRNLSADFLFFRPTVLVCVPLLLEKLGRRIEKEIERRGAKGRSRIFSVVSGFVSEDSRRKAFSAIHEKFGGRLKKIIVGAAPCSKDTVEKFEMYGFRVIIGYGLTECSPIVICNSDIERKSNSIGKALKCAEVKISGADENGVGEITVKGPMVMLGYYKNTEETQKVLRDGWLYTGDLGYADKEGFYYITGRKKNIIVTSGGKNIYPEEIEYHLLKSPLIAECMVYGESDKEITAEIVPDTEEMKRKSKSERLTDEQIRLYTEAVVNTVNKKLPPYKRIKNITIRETEFEKTSTRKIKRHRHRGGGD